MWRDLWASLELPDQTSRRSLGWTSRVCAARVRRRERRERELAERRQVIVTAARELAEAEGWESVTTRRLADRIEYSQPVLYSHFEGKDAIVTAVALEGYGELASLLQIAR